MNRGTVIPFAILVVALAGSAWLLQTRSSAPPADDVTGPAAGGSERVGRTFAEWSVRTDGVLLADIDPGKGASTDPRSFLVVSVKPDGKGGYRADNGPTLSWAPESRGDTSGKLFSLGFRVNTEGRAFIPPANPLWSDPIAKVDAAVDQVVQLRAKVGGATATFIRHASDPAAVPYWNRRAIGFPSDDGRAVYVTPDAIVIPTTAPGP